MTLQALDGWNPIHRSGIVPGSKERTLRGFGQGLCANQPRCRRKRNAAEDIILAKGGNIRDRFAGVLGVFKPVPVICQGWQQRNLGYICNRLDLPSQRSGHVVVKRIALETHIRVQVRRIRLRRQIKSL